MTRPVAIIGGARIPFARSFTAYAEQTNKDMMAATLNGIVDRYDLKGQKIDEVMGGSVISHSRDWNLAREAVLSSKLSPLTPATTMQQACGTSLQAAMTLSGKIATGQIESGIAIGADTASDAPIVVGDKFAKRLVKASQEKTTLGKLKQFRGMSFGELAPIAPTNAEPRTKLSMGQHAELMAKQWGITREAQDALAMKSHLNAAKAYDAGFYDEQVIPYEGLTRDNNIRDDASMESLAKLKRAFDKTRYGTLTAGNSTPLTDGAAGVLLASEEWARERGLPIQAYLTHSRTAAVDFVKGEGLLMAPTVAMSEMLETANLRLQDFDYYELHEAFAAQVLCTLEAWNNEEYCRDRLGRYEPMGEIDLDKLNVNGSSVAYGHPFAATGARLLLNLSQSLAEKGGHSRGVISVCTAGGMGLTAILQT